MGSLRCSAASPAFRRGFCMLTCLAEKSLFIRCKPLEEVCSERACLYSPCCCPKPVCKTECTWEGELSGEIEGQDDTGDECGGDGCSGCHPALPWFFPVPPSSDDVRGSLGRF